ncbi:CpaF family protein [Clostridia bacterium]|nr:CpaF family protein [Clostridia bacterium]
MSDLYLIKNQIRQNVNEKIAHYPDIEDDQLQDVITEEVLSYEQADILSFSQKEKLIVSIYNSMRKLDILQPFLEDDSISEIMINGPDCIFVEKGGRMERIHQSFETSDTLHNIIQNVVTKVNRSVNETTPIVDARLEDGSRVAVVLPPVALQGPIMTIRKFPENPLTMEHLLRSGSMTQEAADFMQMLVTSKYNIFISGGTSSGKTTFLNILSNYIPSEERIVTIEDSAELQIKGKENIIRLEARSDASGGCPIAIRDLIKTALRLRPDRIIVGEVRGREALDMLQAMNTGHDGSLSTGHANNPRDALKRLEVMAVESGEIPLDSAKQQIVSAIDIVVQLSRMGDGKRRVMNISELAGIEKGEYVMNHLFSYNLEKGGLLRTGELLNTNKLNLSRSLNK